ncbi:hypothetical protein [Streptomyces mirabilis]
MPNLRNRWPPQPSSRARRLGAGFDGTEDRGQGAGDVQEPVRLTDPRRLAALAHSGLQALNEPTVRAVVRQAVRDVRTAPPPPPADPPADPTVAALRRVVDDLAASAHAIGELMLEVAPAYLSDTDAAHGVLALLCEEIGEPLEHGLAARRYAMSGDRHALHRPVTAVMRHTAGFPRWVRCGVRV